MYFKNVAGQGVDIFAKGSTGAGQTGDAANITTNISLDGATPSATTNSVSEIGGGLYRLELTQAETNADTIAVYGSSTTSGVLIDPTLIATQGGAVPKVAHSTDGGLYTQGSIVANLDNIAGASYVEGTHALDQQASISELATAIVAAMADVYYVRDFKFVKDDSQSRDEYRSIRWYKNDQPLDSGVTNATIRVQNADTGGELIATTGLTATTGDSSLFLYNATGGQRTANGQAYTVRFSATIDGATRVYEASLGRDSP